jgi:hypothetical protein
MYTQVDREPKFANRIENRIALSKENIARRAQIRWSKKVIVGGELRVVIVRRMERKKEKNLASSSKKSPSLPSKIALGEVKKTSPIKRQARQPAWVRCLHPP